MLTDHHKELIDLLLRQILREQSAAQLAAPPTRVQTPGVTPPRSPS